MIKYRTSWGKIEALEVLRETKKTVVLRGPFGKEVREAKRSDYQNWHDTWEEAHAAILAEAQQKVTSLRAQLERAKGHLGNIKGMKAPRTERLAELDNQVVPGLRAEIERLRAELDALKAQEPYAYAVNFPDECRVELVHDLEELVDDMTNALCEVTSLYAAPAPSRDDEELLRQALDALDELAYANTAKSEQMAYAAIKAIRERLK